MYKLPKSIWKNRLVPYWYLKINKTLTDIDRTKQSQQMLQEYEQKNKLFGLSKRPADKVKKLFLLQKILLYRLSKNVSIMILKNP